MPLTHPSRARLAAAGYVALSTADAALAAARSPRTRRFRLVTKPLLMPVLATAFAESTRQTPSSRSRVTLRRGTLAAQALSGAGDIALLNKTDPAFLAGLGSFFAAHIAYTGSFAAAGRPLSDRSHLGGAKVAASVFLGAAPTIGWAAGRKNPALRGPVTAYIGILTAMFAASSRLGDDLPPQARSRILTGTALFLSSDSIIGLRRFVLPHPTPLSDGAVMATYTAGQALIACGVAQAVNSKPHNQPHD